MKWNLTRAQDAACRAMISTGNSKHAADAMGIAITTFHQHLSTAKTKILCGQDRKTHYLVQYDRRDRTQKKYD